MKTKAVVFLLIVSLLFAACSPSSKIVGRWEDADGAIYEFFKDGTMVIKTGIFSVSGTYDFVDRDNLKLNMDGLWGIGGATVYSVKISGSQLTLSTAGQSFYLQKVK